jgi:protein-L-isoaspartate(D-aspartate) O-methyltransferase
MTEILDLAPGDKVFEVGTGSGYQAAVLSKLVKEVYSIEIIEPLGKTAKERLARLGYRNVKTRVGDGYNGWPEEAPFDAVIVTAGADHIPAPLVEQLKPGGRMIIPVGGVYTVQHLILVEKSADGSVKKRRILPVRFVPLTRKRETSSAP